MIKTFPYRKTGLALRRARLQAAANRGTEFRQAEAAEKLGISSSFLCSLETGRQVQNIPLLLKMNRLYRCNSQEILESFKLLKRPS